MSVVSRCVDGVCYGLLPGEKNDYRPLALRHGPLAVVSVLLLTVKILTVALIALTPATATLATITVDRIVQLTNAERAKAGLTPLTINAKLTSAAKDKGANMLAEDYFAHISPTGVTPWFWMNKYDYTYQVAGENLAIDFVEAEDVVAAWLASPTHRENMLFPTYTETGVAVVSGEFQGGTSIVVVHMFGLPAGTVAPTISNNVKSANSQPTPAPSLSPVKPTPLPTPVLDTIAPPVPRIALTSTDINVNDSVELNVSGEANSLISFLVNNQILATTRLPVSGELNYNLDLSNLPDSSLVLRSFATDTSENQSNLTDPILLTKDTTRPAINQHEIELVLSPATDDASLLATINSKEAVEVLITAGNELIQHNSNHAFLLPIQTDIFSLSIIDAAGNASDPKEIIAIPGFASTETVFTDKPTLFIRNSRILAMGLGLIITLLLIAAIVIHIRIQRPSLIAHSSLVLFIVLGFLLF